MSHRTYNQMWEDANREIKDLMEVEGSQDPNLLPTKDYESQFGHLAGLFIKYTQIFKRVCEAYDQIVHPQKRRVLKLMLDGVTGRVLELHHALVSLNKSDYQYFDAILADLKLSPRDIEIPIPPFFKRENLKAWKERQKILDAMNAKSAGDDLKGDENLELSLEDAIAIIQRHERARQGRLRAKFMQDIRAQEERKRRQDERGGDKLTPIYAATLIQKYARGFLARRRVRKLREQEMEFIGMTMPTAHKNRKEKDDPRVRADKYAEQRRVLQDQYEQQYQSSLVTTKKKIAELEGPDIKENYSDKIREWFMQCREQTGKFPDLPSTEEGGSDAVFNPRPKAPGAEDEAKDEEKEKSAKGKKGDKKSSGKKSAGKEKDKKKSAGKEKKGDKKDKKKKDAEEEVPEDKGPVVSAYKSLLEQGTSNYEANWLENPSDSKNFYQKHDQEIVKVQKRAEVEAELRLQVDELMREELKNLKAAVDKEKATKAKGGKKGKKGKGGKKGKKGAKKGAKKGKKGAKKGKGKKGDKKSSKKDKDPAGDIPPMTIYEELVREGIVKKLPDISLDQIIGQYSFLGTAFLEKKREPPPSLADVRRVMTLYTILPLGSPVVHETQPVHVKSVLLTGPHGTGKQTIAMACANELGANFFDLTPANLEGKYTEKKGANSIEGMLSKVFKVAKALQPSVVYIGDAASVFGKKSKEGPDPTRMAKELPKAVGDLGPGDRVVVIGVDSNPFVADVKDLQSVFDTILIMPRPDYGSRLKLWDQIITMQGGIISTALDLHSLAKVSDGYTASDIKNATKDVLTASRIRAQNRKPLRAVEFVNPLSRRDPVFVEEEEAYAKWWATTSLGKKRARFISGEPEDEGGDEGKDKDKKDKKGKKGGKKSGKKKKK